MEGKGGAERPNKKVKFEKRMSTIQTPNPASTSSYSTLRQTLAMNGRI
jgi:hypothetical protein